MDAGNGTFGLSRGVMHRYSASEFFSNCSGLKGYFGIQRDGNCRYVIARLLLLVISLAALHSRGLESVDVKLNVISWPKIGLIFLFPFNDRIHSFLHIYHPSINISFTLISTPIEDTLNKKSPVYIKFNITILFPKNRNLFLVSIC